MDSFRRWRTYAFAGAVLAVCFTEPCHGQATARAEESVTAKITLGPQQGAAHPLKHGYAKTNGGNIDISQPSPDTLVVTMSGNVAAVGGPFCSADAAFEFLEDLRFTVEFSRPGHTGTLIVQAKAKGLLVSHGKRASAGMAGATASIYAGPHEVATLSLPEQMVGGCDSLAVNMSDGPGHVPIHSGCYGLRQHLHIVASQGAGCLAGGRATAEFSPATLPGNWQGSSSPFGDLDRAGLGYTVILRVVPQPARPTAQGPVFSHSSAAPTPPRAGRMAFVR